MCDGLDVGQTAELRPQVHHYMEETRTIYKGRLRDKTMMIEGELQSNINQHWATRAERPAKKGNMNVAPIYLGELTDKRGVYQYQATGVLLAPLPGG